MSATERRPQRRTVPLPEVEMLPRVGKIRLGVQVAASGRAGLLVPKAVDYFVVNEDDSTPSDAAAAFRAVYPGEPRELVCQLPGAAIDDVFSGAHRLYGASKLKRKCDGVTCDERTATGGWVEAPCICQTLPETVKKKGQEVRNPDLCTLTYTLQVLLPDVSGVGVWQIDTGSEISARRVTAWLTMMLHLRGSLAGLEFTLALDAVKVSPDGNAKTVHVLAPRAPHWTPRQMMAGAPAGHLPALPPPDADERRDPLLDRADWTDDEPAEAAGEEEGTARAAERWLSGLSTDEAAALTATAAEAGIVLPRTVQKVAKILADVLGEAALTSVTAISALNDWAAARTEATAPEQPVEPSPDAKDSGTGATPAGGNAQEPPGAASGPRGTTDAPDDTAEGAARFQHGIDNGFADAEPANPDQTDLFNPAPPAEPTAPRRDPA